MRYRLLILLVIATIRVGSQKQSHAIEEIKNNRLNLVTFEPLYQVDDTDGCTNSTNILKFYKLGLPRDKNMIRLLHDDVCSKLNQDNREAAAFMVGDVEEESTLLMLSYIATVNRLPFILATNRSPVIADRSLHPMVFQILPSWDQEVQELIRLAIYLRFRRFIVLRFNDHIGNAIQSSLKKQKVVSKLEYEIEAFIIFDPVRIANKLYLKEQLATISDYMSRVFIFHASKHQAKHLFKAISTTKLLSEGTVWFVTDHIIVNAPVGALGLSLNKEAISNEAERKKFKCQLFQCGIKALSQSLETLYTYWGKDSSKSLPAKQKMFRQKRDCGGGVQKDNIWESTVTTRNPTLEEELESSKTQCDLMGMPQLMFDGKRQPILAQFQIINKATKNGQLNAVGYLNNTNITGLQEDKIVWCGGHKAKPSGFKMLRTIEVVTVVEKPFVKYRHLINPLNKTNPCRNRSTPLVHWVLCKNGSEIGCCSGFCIDLLAVLANRTNITFEIAIAPHNTYGVKDLKTERWDGMIGEVASGRAMIGVGALTINSERQQVVDFTKPFLYQGITILERKKARKSPVESFVQPFDWTLWVAIFGSVIAVALAIYWLDRVSPIHTSPYSVKRDEEKHSNGDRIITDDDDNDLDDPNTPLGIQGALWFTWGVLLDSGIGESTPRSCSSRILSMVWCGFVMIVMASYTANLAAFLVLDQPEKTLVGIRDPKRHIEYDSLFRKMEPLNKETSDEGIAAVKSGTLNAFFWDSVRLEYEANNDCSLTTAKELFGRSAYAIAIEKDSYWTPILDLQIMDMIEDGTLEDIESKWLGWNAECTSSKNKMGEFHSNKPTQLGLTNMRDGFILVGGGLLLGFILIIIERFWLQRKLRIHQRRQEKLLAQQKQALLQKSSVSHWKRRTRLNSSDTAPDSSLQNWISPKNINIDGVVHYEPVGREITTYIGASPPQIQTGGNSDLKRVKRSRPIKFESVPRREDTRCANNNKTPDESGFKNFSPSQPRTQAVRRLMEKNKQKYKM